MSRNFFSSLLSQVWVAISILYPLENALAESKDLQQIVNAVRQHPVIYSSVDCHYRIEGSTPEAYLRLFPQTGVSSTVEIHLVVQGELYYVSSINRRVMPNGRIVVDSQVTAYDGLKTRHVIDGKLAQISDARIPLGAFITLPHNFGWGRLSQNGIQLLDYLTPLKTRNVRTTVQVVGKARIQGFSCIVIERNEEDLIQKTIEKYRFFICPELGYLVIKSESFYPVKKHQPPLPLIITEAKDWREIAPGLWIPFLAVSTSYVPDPESKNVLSNGTMIYRLLEVNLNPNYPRSFFSNVPMPTDGVIETYRGERLVSRQVVGNPQDEDAGKQGLPPWAWLAGNLLLFALLLAVYLRYRKTQTTPPEAPQGPPPE